MIEPAERTEYEQRLVAAGHPVKDRIAESELRDRYGDLLSADLQLCVGVGWWALVQEALARLAELDLTVSTVREKLGGCQVIAHPQDSWRDDAHMHAAGEVVRDVWERSLITCEVCGEPGARGKGFPIRTRCPLHRGFV